MTNPPSPKLLRYLAEFPGTADELYDWHARPGALERLLPPWQNIAVVSKSGGINPGGEVVLRLAFGPLAMRYRGRHLENQPKRMFSDIQEQGPFSQWHHRHLFTNTPNGAQLHDEVRYRLPLQSLLPDLLLRKVERDLVTLFRRREEVLRHDLRLHQRCSTPPLRFLISGASGVLGRDLLPLLTTGGHRVFTLVRRPPRGDGNEIFWDPEGGILAEGDLPEVDVVIHLAGEYIGLSRWSEEKKRRVLESRMRGTTLLATTLARMAKKPTAFLSASAVGYYGDGRDRIQDEDSPAGHDYISKVCREWERATLPAREAGIRTVLLRLGVGLTPRGGALARLLAASPLGYFRRHGHGGQYVSWISADDMVAAILHTASCQQLHGPVNIVAPQAVTNRELLATMARLTRRPLLCPLPAWLLRMIYGQMASEILLSSCRATPGKLLASGFSFRHPRLEEALASLLGRPLDNIQEG